MAMGFGFVSRTQRRMWVPFFGVSRPCSAMLFSGYSGFPLSPSNISEFQFDLDGVRNQYSVINTADT